VGDDHGQYRAWSLRAQAEWTMGHIARADAAWGQATGCARRAGDDRELFAIRGWHATAAALGPTPVDEGIRRCERLRGLVAASPVAIAWVVNAMALLRAMRGDFEIADRLVQEANETLSQLHSLHSSVRHMEAFVRLLAGKPAVAEQVLRDGIEKLSPSSHGLLATTYAMLGQAVYAQERLGEAHELCRAAVDLAAEDDIVTQVIWRGVDAKLNAREGRCDDAQRLAREAVAIVAPTDLLATHADALLDLAEILESCSTHAAAHEAARTALSLYERKGNAVGAARARSLVTHQSRDG
jgi:tetratricopeptide (TPR) repeat protein